MSQITIEKSTVPQTDVQIEVSMTTQTVIVNNNGVYDIISDD